MMMVEPSEDDASTSDDGLSIIELMDFDAAEPTEEATTSQTSSESVVGSSAATIL